MKRDEIKAIFAEATDEQLQKIMDLNGSDIEKYKGKVAALEAENENKKTALDTLNGELERLRESSADAEDYKSQLETLQKKIADREKAEKEEKEKAEREANILSRYEAAAIGKDGKPLIWRHDAIKADYLKKFGEAISDKANEGKSDTDIFNALVADDKNAFSGGQGGLVLKGAEPINPGNVSKEDFAKMGYKERVKLFNTNKELYENLNGGNE